MGERRLESSRLVCPGIRFLPINWDWQGLSVAASLALVPAVPWTGSPHRVMFAATRVSPGQEDGHAAGLGGTLVAPRARWHQAVLLGLRTGEAFSIALEPACFHTPFISFRSNSSRLKRKAFISTGAFFLREPFLARGAVNC